MLLHYLLILCTAGAILAQTPGPQNPIARVTTRLVQLNVVVHDHHGNPASDLSRDDFEVADQGKAQTIALFRMDSVSKGPEGPAKIMPRNEFSNRLDRQSQVPTSATVILMDFLNTPWRNQADARRQVLKFLRQIHPEDRVALYSMSGRGVRVVHDFSNNSQALIAALARTMPEVSRDLTDTERDEIHLDESVDANSPLAGVMDGGFQAEAAFMTRDRVMNTCAVMKTLAEHLSGVTGRKNLVWVSAGFPISFGFGDPAVPNPIKNNFSEMYSDYVEDASRAMNTANVAVYPVDARGLFGLPMFDASKPVRVNPRTHQPAPEMIHVDNRNIDTMVYLADLTGGKAFYNSNDIEGAIRKAIDDSAVTYTLGYYTSDANWDGKFHRIKVKVKRGGLSVRTKKGYFAREQSAPSPQEINRATYDALWSPLDASSIGLSARIDPSDQQALSSRILMVLNPFDLQFKQEQGRFDASVDLIFAQLTKRGKRLADQRQSMSLNLKPDTYQKIMHDGMLIRRDLKIGRDTESVRVVVVDRDSGAVGTLTVPVSQQDISQPAASQ